MQLNSRLQAIEPKITSIKPYSTFIPKHHSFRLSILDLFQCLVYRHT
jgi:hypothetical protein